MGYLDAYYRRVRHQRITVAVLPQLKYVFPDFLVLGILFDIGGADSMDLNAGSRGDTSCFLLFRNLRGLETNHPMRSSLDTILIFQCVRGSTVFAQAAGRTRQR